MFWEFEPDIAVTCQL